MSDTTLAAPVRERPATQVPHRPAPATPPIRRPLLTRLLGLIAGLVPSALALGAVGGLAYVGRQYDWRMPKFSALIGQAEAEKDDWCEEHSVPDSECVECKKGCLPRDKEHGWCRTHGVSECPLCFPQVAQLPAVPVVTSDDRQRAEDALAFAPRAENNSKCKLNQRRIQFTSDEAVSRLGIAVTPVGQALVTETVTANGEVGFDPTKMVRLSARVPGTLWRVEKQVGDRVRQGEVLALVDALDVGKAKAEFQQALVNLDLKTQTLANLKASVGGVSEKNVQEAEAALAEAQVRLLAARQALQNLGFAARTEDYAGLAPADAARRLQFLGLPAALAEQVARQTASSNLLPIRAPFDGEVIERNGVPGEAMDPARVLFVVADTRRLWLTLQARLEDVGRIQPGQKVRFRHDGHDSGDIGTVVWVSPAVDEKTRTVPVRVEWPNVEGRHQARTFGTAQVVLRQEPNATVVPSGSVHWEGDCHVVFVRDKNFEKSPYKVFHVRKVRPGAKDVGPSGPVTEVVGVLPGELVATANSGILRSELLKNNLGAG